MQIFNEIVGNQDLHRNKDDFWKKIQTENFKNLMENILYIKSISVKCIFWQI